MGVYYKRKAGYDTAALRNKSNRNTERIYALRHKATGLYFRRYKQRTSTTAKPFAMSKAVMSYYFNEFERPEDWEIVKLEVSEFKPLEYNERQRIAAIQHDAMVYAAEAEYILDGGENYDGADGTRIVAELCDDVSFLLDVIKKMECKSAA